MVWLAAAGAAACAGLAGWMAREAFRVRLRREEVALPRLPGPFDGFRVLFISDIHRRSVRPLAALLKAQAETADLVLVGGDLTERGVPEERVRTNVRLLAGIAPVFAVFGNHDYDDDAEKLAALLEEEGCTLLRNESRAVERAGRKILVAGTDDPSTGRDDVRAALHSPSGRFHPGRRQVFTILLAHDPLIVDRMTAEDMRMTDLILAGHTHGGQIVPPILGAAVRGHFRYLRGWCKPPGRRKTGGAERPRLFVSCGYGTSHLPLRLSAPAEAHLFTLRRLRRPQDPEPESR
jgi:predicted MPP superfamily phosphohydrolase